MTSYKGSPKDILKSLVIILPGGERGSWRILDGGGGATWWVVVNRQQRIKKEL